MTVGDEKSDQSTGHSAPFRVLSVDGGGYLGLASAVFIQQIERHFEIKFCEQFDLFCGTSTGAIIAAALASGKSGDELVALYTDLGPRIFAKKQSRGFFKPRYSLTPLRECLEEQLGSTTLGDLQANDRRVLITAFNRTAGIPRLFKTDHSENLTTDSELKLVDVVLASACAPIIFPSILIENPTTGLNEVFCDGGVACNHPALLGFTEAAYEIGVPPNAVRLLSISTPRQSLAEGIKAQEHRNYGMWHWKKSIHTILIDSNSNLVHESLKRLVGVFADEKPAYVRVALDNDDNLGIDDVSERATQKLTNVGARAATNKELRKGISTILRD